MFNQKEHLKKIANTTQECSCLICNNNFKKFNALGAHLQTHNISSKEYYDKFIGKPLICNCGNQTLFRSISKGYSKFCSSKCHTDTFSEFNPGGYKKNTKTAKAHSKRMKGNKFAAGNHSRRGVRVVLSEEHKEKIRKHLHDNINSKGLNIPNGARCKFFDVADLRVQGKWELAYILNRINHGFKLPNKAKTIVTPFGPYTPDFEFDDKYIEIKSIYTIRTSKKSGQWKKIKWVDENIKKVKVILMTETKVKLILNESDYDLEKTKAIRIS